MRAALILAAAFTSVLLSQQPAEQKPPTFTSGTQAVQVDVRVFDKDGHFATSLRPEDFEIKEDGVTQPIVSLTLVRSSAVPALAPPAPSAPAPLAPSASLAPLAPTPSEPAPSTWLFLFDTIHLSPGGLNRSRGAVLNFVNRRLQQGDLAGVLADGKMINNRLTTEREEVARAVDSIRLPGETAGLQRQLKAEVPRFADENEAYRIAELEDGAALSDAVRRGCEDDPTLCPTMPELVRGKARDLDARLHQGSILTLLTLRALAHGLARMPGPKTIVYVSEGFMLWNVQSELKDAVGELNRAGGHIYAIDARGLNKGHNADLLTAAFADDPGAGPRFDEQVDGPNSLAIDTGGMFIQNENNIGRALDTIQQDAGTYYVLAYSPSNQAFDGKYRTISVKSRRPDLAVRARRGYLAIDPAAMLKPVAITAPAAAAAVPFTPAAQAAPGAHTTAITASAAAPAANTATPIPPAAAPAASEPPAGLAEAVRSRIDKGGLVATLRGNDSAAAGDAASLGWAAYQRGDVESAERELTTAAAGAGAHPWVHYVLGLCHLALSEYPQAAASWERVRDAVPTFEPVYFNLADAYLLQNDTTGALRVLGTAAGRWPSDAEVFNAEGVIELRAQAFDAAIDAFEKATRAAPKDPLGFFNLASAHHGNYLRLRTPTPTPRQFMLTARERDQAIDAYRRVVTLREDYVDQAKKGLAALDAEK